MRDAERNRYLAELDASLPMPLERRAQILEGPNGTRYVIADGGGVSGTFTGSAWDWVVAVTRD